MTNYKNCKYTDEYCASGECTLQWKKGELPEGYYYVKDGENMIAEYLDGYFYNDGNPMTSFSGGVDEVLAPVPSYEEWQAKLAENAQLKDLLEECSRYVGHSAASRMIKNSAGHKKDMKLLTKIDEVLQCGNIK